MSRISDTCSQCSCRVQKPLLETSLNPLIRQILSASSTMTEKRSKAVALFHEALSKPDKNKEWDFWFMTDDVVLHKNDLSLDHDIKGIGPVQSYFQSYAQNYSSHTLLQYAVGQEDPAAFAYFCSQGATLQNEASARAADSTASQAPMAAHQNADKIIGLAAYMFSEQGQMQDIYFTRQLTGEEMQTRMKDEKMNVKLDPEDFNGSKSPPGHQSQQAVYDIAQKYSQLWNNGDVGQVRDLLEEDCVEVDAFSGSSKQGRDPIQKMMEGVNQGWQVYDNTSQVATTQDAGLAFVFWASKGKGVEKSDTATSLFGISLLVMSKDKRIAKILSLRQPLPEEKTKLMK